MDLPLSEQEIRGARDILSKFYGNQAKSWQVTPKTFEVMGRLIDSTSACDRLMDLVPRFFGGGSAINWGQKQVRESVLRKLNSNEGKHYIVCMRASAASMRTDFYMAGF